MLLSRLAILLSKSGVVYMKVDASSQLSDQSLYLLPPELAFFKDLKRAQYSIPLFDLLSSCVLVSPAAISSSTPSNTGDQLHYFNCECLFEGVKPSQNTLIQYLEGHSVRSLHTDCMCPRLCCDVRVMFGAGSQYKPSRYQRIKTLQVSTDLLLS